MRSLWRSQDGVNLNGLHFLFDHASELTIMREKKYSSEDSWRPEGTANKITNSEQCLNLKKIKPSC